ncbi:hypothetical protein [Hoylesella timonensis]|uniref:hypothetical protein n=1 Tax=Hoylesella timonensis TaxID=386414 RepID=UPI00055C7657|nr:hypothetical protein [Hoylesella timonensis]
MQSKPNINRVSLGTKREEEQTDGFVSRAMAVFPTASFPQRNLETKPSEHSENAITVKVGFGQGGAAFSRNAIAH